MFEKNGVESGEVIRFDASILSYLRKPAEPLVILKGHHPIEVNE